VGGFGQAYFRGVGLTFGGRGFWFEGFESTKNGISAFENLKKISCANARRKVVFFTWEALLPLELTSTLCFHLLSARLSNT